MYLRVFVFGETSHLCLFLSLEESYVRVYAFAGNVHTQQLLSIFGLSLKNKFVSEEFYTYGCFNVCIWCDHVCLSDTSVCACNEGWLYSTVCADLFCMCLLRSSCKHRYHWDLTQFVTLTVFLFLCTTRTISVSILINNLFLMRITVDRAGISFIICCSNISYIYDGCYQYTSWLSHQCPVALF